jgi:RNA 2',3'-cyclic 3'-phosphodiesterase
VLRTFLALDLEEGLLRQTLALMDELRIERLPRARWCAEHALHVTLRFLGDTDEALVPALSEVVSTLGAHALAPVEIRSTSLLAFPNAKRAHVLALHLEDGGALATLAAIAEQEVTALGFRAEERRFRPHLTLARFREPADLRRVFASRHAPMRGGRLVAIALYKSDLGGPAPVHTPLARHALVRETAPSAEAAPTG